MKLRLIAVVVTTLFCMQAYADQTNPNTLSNQTPTAVQDQTPRQVGETFLKQNKMKKDVVTLSDGLQYKVIKHGKGPKPGPNDTVTVDYVGKLVNGQEFDSSKKNGGPVKFQVGQVIPGWVEALQLMPVGSTWEIYVPENLAYGDRGAPPAIGPNEALIFTITLLKTEKG